MEFKKFFRCNCGQSVPRSLHAHDSMMKWNETNNKHVIFRILSLTHRFRTWYQSLWIELAPSIDLNDWVRCLDEDHQHRIGLQWCGNRCSCCWKTGREVWEPFRLRHWLSLPWYSWMILGAKWVVWITQTKGPKPQTQSSNDILGYACQLVY